MSDDINTTAILLGMRDDVTEIKTKLAAHLPDIEKHDARIINLEKDMVGVKMKSGLFGALSGLVAWLSMYLLGK